MLTPAATRKHLLRLFPGHASDYALAIAAAPALACTPRTIYRWLAGTRQPNQFAEFMLTQSQPASRSTAHD